MVKVNTQPIIFYTFIEPWYNIKFQPVITRSIIFSYNQTTMVQIRRGNKKADLLLSCSHVSKKVSYNIGHFSS